MTMLSKLECKILLLKIAILLLELKQSQKYIKMI
jgi:hypothetical protein